MADDPTVPVVETRPAAPTPREPGLEHHQAQTTSLSSGGRASTASDSAQAGPHPTRSASPANPAFAIRHACAAHSNSSPHAPSEASFWGISGGSGDQAPAPMLRSLQFSSGSAGAFESGTTGSGSPLVGGTPPAGRGPSTTYPLPPRPPPSDSADSQLCLEVRLPPLRPRGGTLPSLLAACCGGLFALPGGSGVAMLQWATDGRDLAAPLGCVPAEEEDFDAAPCGAVPLPEGAKASPVLCVCADERGGTLWTGHESGQVCQWGVTPCRAARYEQHWQAHSVGEVAGLCVTAWGDLWTASSTGNIKMWAFPGAADGLRAPVRVEASHRLHFYLKRLTVAPTGVHNCSKHVVVGSGGRVVWSSGDRSLNLFSAHSGEHLGYIRDDREHDNSSSDEDIGHDPEDALAIDVDRGLDDSSVASQFHARRLERRTSDGDAEAEAMQGVVKPSLLTSAVHSAARFAKKLQKKVTRHLPSIATMEAAGTCNLPPPLRAGRIKAMTPALNGGILVAYKSGQVQKFTELGRLLWSVQLPARSLCMVCVGGGAWVGAMDGHIRVLDLRAGQVVRDWAAHLFPVASLAVAGPMVYSLCADGSVRGWSATPPTQRQLAAWQEGLPAVLRRLPLRVLTGTWNVNASRPSPASLHAWLGGRAQSSKADLVIVSLQEVEVGAQSLAVDVAFSYLLKQKPKEKGNRNARWWTQSLLDALDPAHYSCVALRQRSGMIVIVYCRKELEPRVGEVATSSVACGVLGVGVNKGGVAISMSIHRRRFVAVCSHFAAHMENVEDRNADYAKIMRHLKFADVAVLEQLAATAEVSTAETDGLTAEGAPIVTIAGDGLSVEVLEAEAPQPDMDRPPSSHKEEQSAGGGDDDADGGAATVEGEEEAEATAPETEEEVQAREAAAGGGAGGEGAAADAAPPAVASGPSASATSVGGHLVPAVGPGLPDAAVLVWAGDFNYRVEGEYEAVQSLVAQGRLEELLDWDQCRREQRRGNAFVGLSEGAITFAPTFKFDPHVGCTQRADGRLPYDTSEKRRVPAWCDRVFFRGSLPGRGSSSAAEARVTMRGPEDYGAAFEACDSDHKPVFALLDVDLPAFVQDARRALCSRVLAGGTSSCTPGCRTSEGGGGPAAAGQLPGPELITVSERAVLLQAGHPRPQTLVITNPGTEPCIMTLGGGGGTASLHLPPWLEVTPTSAMLAPGDTLTLSLRAVQPLSGQGEEAQLEELPLLLPLL